MRMPSPIVVLPALVIGFFASCGSDGGSGSDAGIPDFGHADPCPYTRLMNEPDDANLLSEGRACFDRTVAEGTPITWDLEVFTVEGDPIYYRAEWDESGYSILLDARADEFGRQDEILTYECAELSPNEIPSCP